MDPSLAAPEIPVDTTNRVNGVVLPVFAVIATVITYLPFRSFYQNRNFPAVNLVVLANIMNLIIFVNAILWPDGDWTTWWSGVGLCDIQAYIRLPLTTAVATSLLAFTRTLVNALDVDKHNFMDTPALRRRVLIIDVLICWTIPVMQIALYYVVQVSRYVIIPIYGCGNLTDNSWVFIVIYLPWAPLCSLISGFHAVLIMFRLHKHKANLSKALSSSNSGFTARRYLKLFMIAVFLIVIFLPIQLYGIPANIPPELVPYSWSRVHDPVSWNAVVYLSTSDIPILQYNGWFSVAMCFQIFLFFGFNDDALETYRKGLVKLGFAKIWPSLREPRDTRRLWTRRDSATRTSWTTHLDLVGKALRYFDSSRSGSQATTVLGSEFAQSRKGSQAAASDTNAITTVTSNISTFKNPDLSSAGGPYEDESFFITNAITPAPLAFEQTSTIPPVQAPQPVTSASGSRRILTTWRTHIQLPFPLFSAKTTVSATTEKRASVDKHLDIESQSPRHKSSLSRLTNQVTTVSTSIWSETSPHDNSTINAAPTTQNQAFRLSADGGGDRYPLSPKVGSRAYRERERREMQQDMKEAREEMSRNKIVEAQRLGGGVVVKTTRMEMSEEGPSSPPR